MKESHQKRLGLKGNDMKITFYPKNEQEALAIIRGANEELKKIAKMDEDWNEALNNLVCWTKKKVKKKVIK